jgi:flagellar hook protein FlgE
MIDRYTNCKTPGGYMVDAIQSTLSALSAFDKKMQVTANNVANVNTNEFKKSQVVLSEGENGGVRVELHKVNTPGYPTKKIKDDELVDTETSNVDLAEETGESIVTQHAYDANLKVLKTQDEILGSLINIIG